MDRMRHFKEQVVNSIPFHEKMLDDHVRRLDYIKKIMPYRKYRKLVAISLKYGGVPEYLVYDKAKNNCFFVLDNKKAESETWLKKTKKIIDTILLGKNNLNSKNSILEEVENDIM